MVSGPSVPLAVLLLAFSQPARAFCENPSGDDGRSLDESCHPQITEDALPFLRPELLDQLTDHVNDPDEPNFAIITPGGLITLDLGYSSDEHFDHCNFDGAIDLINTRYTADYADYQFGPPHGVVPLLSPYAELGLSDPRVHRALERWAHVLHAAQDFYAHSNWVELGQLSLVDSGSGTWTDFQVDAFDEPFIADIVATQLIAPDYPSAGWEDDVPYDYSGDGRVLAIDVDDQTHRLLASGTINAASIGQGCPSGTLSHDGLNKDNSSRTYYEVAAQLARHQTEQEWCRLLELSYDEWGAAGAGVVMGLLVDPDADPHPAGTTCETPDVGDLEIGVRVSRIFVRDDGDDGDPGELSFVLTAFSDDFMRSARSATGPLSVDSGDYVDSVDHPGTLSMCLDADQELIVTLQGWDDDDDGGARGDLDDDDDLRDGVTFGPYSVADIAALDTVLHLSRDSDDDNDLTVDIELDGRGTDADGDGLGACAEGVLGTDQLVWDSDGDGLGDGDEVNVYHTDPLAIDSDEDTIDDGLEVTWGSNPLMVDTDDDGLDDAGDPGLVSGALAQLDDESFKNRGQQRSMPQRVDEAEALVLSGDLDSALDSLDALRKKLDGCEDDGEADPDDGTVDCADQDAVRGLLDIVVGTLEADLDSTRWSDDDSEPTGGRSTR